MNTVGKDENGSDGHYQTSDDRRNDSSGRQRDANNRNEKRENEVVGESPPRLAGDHEQFDEGVGSVQATGTSATGTVKSFSEAIAARTRTVRCG